MITQIKTFQEYRYLLWEFVKKDIKLKYRNSILGIVWSMLNPLLIMLVLTFLFSTLFKSKIPNFPVYCLSRVISSFIIFLISLIPLAGIMIITKVKVTKVILLSFYPLICLFFICLGVGLILATINVFFRDMQHLYSVVLMIIMYASAIFYSADIINPKYVAILNLNPIFPVIKVFRDCVLYGKITAVKSWVLCPIYAVILLIIGVIVFYKKQDKFILHI